MSLWPQHVPTDNSGELPSDPRPSRVSATTTRCPRAGRLVDNSIDAGATHVLIRFVQQQADLFGLHMMDSGRGIEPERSTRR